MKIDENGKIFEEIELQDKLPEEKEAENLNNLDEFHESLESEKEINSNLSFTNIKDEDKDSKIIIEDLADNSNNETISNTLDEQILDKIDTYDNDFEKHNLPEENKTAETTCLALTVRKDYNLSVFKNSVLKTFKVTLKVTLCTFFLNLLSLFL